jgi:Helix-turn-helix domain
MPPSAAAGRWELRPVAVAPHRPTGQQMQDFPSDATPENRPFDWSGLVALTVHPVKVAIVEAFLWIERPLSATELRELFDRRNSVSPLSYHLRTLAELGVLREVDTRQVRGAIQRLYFFAEA